MQSSIPAATLVVGVLCAPFAMAHGAPSPPEEATRLLADWDDDCGGDGGAVQGNCRGSDDVIALDVQERADAQLGDVVVFRFYLDKGKTYPITNTLSLRTPAGMRTFSMQTSDDAAFTNQGFDRLGQPVLLQDGTRFTVDGTVSLATLGMQAGQSFSDFKVESKTGGSTGDYMPGGCNNTVGSCVDTGQSSDQYIAGGGNGNYRLRGPTYYARITAPASGTVAAGETQVFLVDVKNQLRRTIQEATVTVEGGAGVVAKLRSSGEFRDTATVALAGSESSSIELRLEGVTHGASGTLKIIVTTDKGGQSEAAMAYSVTAGIPSPTTQPTTTSKASPGLAPLALAAVCLALAGARRRR